ncbi:MAG: CocE/NonD family hydrolase [Candidatus Rokubacteria bacterium]|nr:CocE/NonD family hydrolase [Candidatus Rokubacteria bacterium]
MRERVRLVVERDVPVPMRDGTTLYADVYRPEGSGRHPVILLRTPYNKALPRVAYQQLDPMRAASRGYALVVQDTRGRFASEGDFSCFANEIDDGFDTVEWAAREPWSDGNVGMYGASYMGATQWLAALARPPHLKCIVPMITASDYHEGWAYQGGAFQLGFNMSWTLANLVLPNLAHWKLTPDEVKTLRGELIEAVDRMCGPFERLPLKNYPTLRKHRLADYYDDWLEHPEDDAYWRQWNVEARHAEITVPALNIGGWHDIFLGGTLRNYMGMRRQGGTPASRNQRLIIGPWVHGLLWPNVNGDVDYGVLSQGLAIDLDGILLRWFDHWLRGIDTGLLAEPPVKLFVMGDNAWRDESDWPLSRAVDTRFHLHGGGRANSSNGDGRLDASAPAAEASDHYLYDPRNPVPTRGGALCCWQAALPSGAYDQRPVEARPDVLVYTTAPLTAPVEVIGPVTVKLWASSSAPDTDFTAKLVDVDPTGFARNLTDGIVRARYRESTARASLIEPGRVYEYTIDLWATANVFRTGHRIRLEISSSNFPRFDRNPNTGHALGADAELRPAMQTIRHDATHPSHVVLPIVPR